VGYFLVCPLSEAMTLSVLQSYFIVPARQEPRGVVAGHGEGGDTRWGRSMEGWDGMLGGEVFDIGEGGIACWCFSFFADGREGFEYPTTLCDARIEKKRENKKEKKLSSHTKVDPDGCARFIFGQPLFVGEAEEEGAFVD